MTTHIFPVGRIFAVVFAVAVQMGLPALLQGAPAKPGTVALASPTKLVFEPSEDYEKLVLTVAGPGDFLYRDQFASDDLAAFDLTQQALADGSYTWELVLVPRLTDEMRQALKEARALDDEGAPALLATRDRLPRGRRQSGHFLLRNGEIVLPTAEPSSGPEPRALPSPQNVTGEPASAARPRNIQTDLSVSGQACIGNECTDDETFGPHTLRLKEVHPSLKFEDLSTAPPNNDWQLSANGSGAGTFSLEDLDGGTSPFQVVAGAPSNALHIDDQGQVGLGTATPAADAHIVSPNTPALRLEQDGSAGLAAQTWEVAGNESDFFVRDVTNGSSLPLRIRPGAPTSALDIAANGNVGIGEPSPEDMLHLSGNTSSPLHIRLDNGRREWALRLATNDNFNISDLTSTGSDQFRIASGAPSLSLVVAAGGGSLARVGIGTANPQHPLQVGLPGGPADGNGAHVTADGVWTNASSREFKTDIHGLSLEAALEAFAQLEPVVYRGKTTGADGEQYVGFIAEDVPELVAMNDRKSLASMDIVAVLTRVVQMQQQELEQLRSEAAATVSALAERLERLEEAQP